MLKETISRKRRVLWLFNHEALGNFNLPLFDRLGYEVFIPKKFPRTEEWSSACINTKYDSALTIPENDLKLLNQHNFFEQTINRRLAKIINQYFSSAFFGAFPFLFNEIINSFSGILFYHVFGMLKKNRYELLLNDYLIKKIHSIKNRFVFAQAYPFLAEIEPEIYQKTASYLPIGIPDTFFQFQNCWKGGNGKLLFVCPRISSSDYYKNIYISFKQNFSHIPHIIAGKQLFPIADAAIQGFLSREEFNALLIESDVMFYHSEEPRHLHYHPLEAIIFGLPLIYMKNSLLSRMTNYLDLPGACNTIQEAKEKILRILHGDKILVHSILHTQNQLLAPFRNEYCQPFWQKNFVEILEK